MLEVAVAVAVVEITAKMVLAAVAQVVVLQEVMEFRDKETEEATEVQYRVLKVLLRVVAAVVQPKVILVCLVLLVLAVMAELHF
jgi:hypothetical protein